MTEEQMGDELTARGWVWSIRELKTGFVSGIARKKDGRGARFCLRLKTRSRIGTMSGLLRDIRDLEAALSTMEDAA